MTKAAVEVPARLNGYPVLHSSIIEGDAHTVIVFREGHPAHRFVVASWSPLTEPGWAHGDYARTLPEAMALAAGRT